MAQRAEPRFLTAITPPPVVKAKGEPSWWPAWRYHPTLGGKIFQTEQDFAAVLVGDPTWAETPYDEPPKTVPMDLNTAAGQASANLALVGRLVEENGRLQERNAQLETKVQEMSPAAEKLKAVEEDLKITKSALKAAQHTIDQIRAGQAAARRASGQASKAAKAEAPAETLAQELAGTPEPAAVVG